MADQHLESGKAKVHKSGDKSLDSEHAPAEKPVSLRPLKFEEAVQELLKITPKKSSEG